MSGFIASLFIAGFIKLFDSASGKKKDRVELPPHIWQGNTLKPHYNRRFLGPIKIETFISSSKLMVKAVNKYSQYITFLSEKLQQEGYVIDANSTEFTRIHKTEKQINKYMKQIDRRSPMRCYKEWRESHPESFNDYQEARGKALPLMETFNRIKMETI